MILLGGRILLAVRLLRRIGGLRRGLGRRLLYVPLLGRVLHGVGWQGGRLWARLLYVPLLRRRIVPLRLLGVPLLLRRVVALGLTRQARRWIGVAGGQWVVARDLRIGGRSLVLLDKLQVGAVEYFFVRGRCLVRHGPDTCRVMPMLLGLARRLVGRRGSAYTR